MSNECEWPVNVAESFLKADWLLKPIQTIEAKSVDLGLMLTANINDHDVCCILE